MFHKHLLRFLVLLSLILLAASPTRAQAGSATDTDASDGCTGTWTFPPLYVGGPDGVVFAHAAYEFDAKCQPVLVSQVRLNYVPAWATTSEQAPVESKTVPIVPPPPPDDGEAGLDAVDTCHLRT